MIPNTSCCADVCSWSYGSFHWQGAMPAVYSCSQLFFGNACCTPSIFRRIGFQGRSCMPYVERNLPGTELPKSAYAMRIGEIETTAIRFCNCDEFEDQGLWKISNGTGLIYAGPLGLKLEGRGICWISIYGACCNKTRQSELSVKIGGRKLCIWNKDCRMLVRPYVSTAPSLL